MTLDHENYFEAVQFIYGVSINLTYFQSCKAMKDSLSKHNNGARKSRVLNFKSPVLVRTIDEKKPNKRRKNVLQQPQIQKTTATRQIASGSTFDRFGFRQVIFIS